MKYKKSLKRITYFCLAYTGIMFIMLFLLFFFPSTQKTKADLDKNSANISSRFSFMATQYDAIYNETVNSSYFRSYINNGSKFDKMKLQSFLASYADSAAPSIYLISVISGDADFNNTTVIGSRNSMTYDYFADSLSLGRDELTEKIRLLEDLNGKSAPDIFISGIPMRSCCTKRSATGFTALPE